MLTAPYCDQINAGKNYIYSVLEKTDLSGAAKKRMNGIGHRLFLKVTSCSMGLEMVPLYTDLNLMLYLFPPNIRVSVVDFETARRLSLQDKDR